MELTKDQVQALIKNKPPAVSETQILSDLTNRGYSFQGVDMVAAKNYLAQQQIAETPVVEPKKKSLLRQVGEDVVGTLVVKPAARATEALTRVVAPNSQAAKGYEAMADEGQSQTFGGIEVGQQEAFGQGGGREIVSDTLKTASYLFPYGKVAGVGAKALGGGAAAKVAGAVASGATGGYAADVGFNLADESKTIGESLKPGAGTLLGAAIPASGPLVRGAGRAVSKTGSELVDLAIPTSVKEAQILQAYKADKPLLTRISDVLKGTSTSPQTAAKTTTEKGFMGTKSNIGVQAKRATQKLWDELISPRLKASDQAVDLDGFFAKVEGDIKANNPELSRQNSLLEALEAVKEDYSGIKAVSLEQLQKLKEGWAKFVPDKAYKGKPIAGAFNDVRNELAKESRNTIYSQLGDDVKQAYFDYGNLQGLQEMGQVAMTGSKLKGGAGSFIQDIVSQAVTPVATIGGQVLYRVGKGIEFIGNAGAKNVGQALGIKFPGDAAVDAIKNRVNDFKKIPNKQGGFLDLGAMATKKITTDIKDAVSKELNNLDNRVLKVNGKLDLTGSDVQFRLDQLKTILDKRALTTKEVIEANKLLNDVGIDVFPGKSLKVKGTIPENSLAIEARKYKTTVNIQDKNDLDYLRRILSEDNIKDIQNGKMVNFRGTPYEDLAKVNLISKTPQTIEQQLAGRIKNTQLKSDTFYHGTSANSAKEIMESGFKSGSELPENAYRGGGYGHIQEGVSFAETPKEAGIFSTLTKGGEIVEAKLKKGAKVVTIDGVEDAVDLADYIKYLKKQGVDAVYIGGGEKELVVLNTKAVTPVKSQLTDIYNKAVGKAKK